MNDLRASTPKESDGRAGFTVVEVLITLVIASLLMIFVLSLTRSQLVTYEMQGQVTAVQQNARAGFDFVEQSIRRACAGVAAGAVELRVSAATNGVKTGCMNIYDGAVPAAGSFSGGALGSPVTLPDAIELIYADGGAFSMVTLIASPVVHVADTTGFQVGDLVLIGDYRRAYLHQIASILPPPVGFGPQQGDITMTVAPASDPTFLLMTPPLSILRARSVALYVDTATDPKNPLLRLDPDGVAGTTHADAEPLVEGVEDFQLAVGIDSNGDGVINENVASPGSLPPSDEWSGNALGELPLASPVPVLASDPPPIPWDPLRTPFIRTVRASLIARSLNQYAGSPAQVGPMEDRTTWPYAPGATSGPRFRQLRMVIAPRVWNLTD
jgi:prepilin-type N-terminal cleavage/methylation domain-containing protein